MFRTARILVAVLAVLAIGVSTGSASTPSKAPTKQDIAKKILASRAGQTLSAPARAYMEMVARNDHRLTPDTNSIAGKVAKVTSAKGGGGTPLVNVRVNNPANDSHQTDQTTQSETSVAVSGSNVAVGFNNSQHSLQPFLTAGTDISGVAYSSDGGQTFTDGGALPNAPGNVNLGDPWLASDSSGAMYYSNLVGDGATGFLLVGVSRSTDGGKTWTPAASIQPPPAQFFYSADKDALIAGPGNGNLYDVWDDFTVDPVTFNELSGLPVAHSTDGGKTWSITYASQVPIFDASGTGCSFNQYIGAQPLAAGGMLYVASEKISVDDPNCIFPPATFSEVIFASKDGGSTWTPGAAIPITSSTPQGFGAFQLGASQYMRNLEFPTLASFKGSVYMAWNDGGDGSGHSHIRLAQLNSSGQLARSSFVTSGANDEVQPAISADSSLHIAYYQISTNASGDGQLDVFASNSNNGNSWKVQRVTSQSFPGVFTSPQFDPLIAPGYMGDYIANVSDGTHQFFAWGDNRDIVTNFLWPTGRHDPDVFFARQ